MLTRSNLKTPRAAAIAGVVSSVLLIIIFWLLRVSVPADPLEPGEWLSANSKMVTTALSLVPFAGIAFLWFIGALRDRLGDLEDRFFATVFLGSGLLFLAMLFVASAILGAVVLVFATERFAADIATFHLARAVAYNAMNAYAIKMAGVFIISTSTVVIYTRIVPRWIAVLGYALALLLLIGSYYLPWSFMVMPIWVLLISSRILLDNIRQPSQRAE